MECLRESESEAVEAGFEREEELVLQLVNSSINTYSFEESQFEEALRLLIANRIQNAPWRAATSNAHYLRVVQCLRLISRDLRLFMAHFSGPLVLQLVEDLKEHVKNHFTYGTYGCYVELASELLSTLKRVFMVRGEARAKWKPIERVLLDES